MNNERPHPHDLDERIPLPDFIRTDAPQQTAMVETTGRAVDVTAGLERDLAPRPTGVQVSLDELARLISAPPRVPEIGMQASRAMAKAFETVASDIEAAAKDGVDRANAIHQEALSYAAVIRESGALLCEKIEAEASRAFQLSTVMREAKRAFSVAPPASGG